MKRRVLGNSIFLLLAILLLFFTVSVAAFAADATRISCTMYADGATGRGFCWFTEKDSGSDLQLIKTQDFDGSFDGATTYSGTSTRYRGRISHQVAVTNLSSGTAYTYRVGDAASGVWSDVCSFVTDDKDDTLSFITIADVQASSDESFAHAAKTMEAAMKTLPQAEFVVNLGDYVNDNTNAEWDWYFQNFSFANNHLTHVPVAGNHDGNITNKLNTNCFVHTFCLDRSANRSIEGVYYSFDYGNVHFSVLNTNDMYPMSQAQRNWLIDDMTGTRAHWKVILMHRSLYSAGKNINKPDTIIMRNDLLPLIDRLGIDLVLSGHDHMYLRTGQVYAEKIVNDVSYVTEDFHGEPLRFAKDPRGTVYALPSTAGTKRYAVNQNAMPPILDVAEVALSTQTRGGCFATVAVAGEKLVYKAYAVDDKTQEITEFDRYALMKTMPAAESPMHLDTSLVATVVGFPFNLAKALVQLLGSYVKLLVTKIF